MYYSLMVIYVYSWIGWGIMDVFIISLYYIVLHYIISLYYIIILYCIILFIISDYVVFMGSVLVLCCIY